MWKLTEIYAQNVCSFRQLEYGLSQGITTLIFGDNRDNESQRSNGSGKSALIECIAIGITGSPLRKIKNEEIINDNADESLIELTFVNDSTGEKFQIERKLFRKGPAEVTCRISRGGELKLNEGVQPGIDAYNKYILEKLGVTKEELYNNFILSKHKYQDFLSCSDKEKKEIINRFSNGNMVDQAIDKILEDKNPLVELQKKTDLEYAGLEGRIDVLGEQIEKEENSKEERTKSKADKINELNNLIAEKRNDLRCRGQELGKLDAELVGIEEVDKLVQDLENGDFTLEEYLAGIERYIPIVNKRPMSDWNSIIKTKKEKIHQAEERLKEWDAAFSEAEIKIKKITYAYNCLNDEYNQFTDGTNIQSKAFDDELQRLETNYKTVNAEIESIKKIRRALTEGIEALKNKLAGVITCPACGFEFIVADAAFDVEKGKKDVGQKEEEYITLSSRMNAKNAEIENIDKAQHEIKEKKREIAIKQNEWGDRIISAEREVKTAQYELDGAKRTQNQIIESINQLQTDIDGILRQVFDEAFEYIDEAYKSNERKTRSVSDDIKAFESSIETLENTIGELNKESGSDILSSLKQSLKDYRKQASKVLTKKTGIEEEMQVLCRQEQNFIEFKTYLANTKIEALSKITNEFLENIGSDIRIRFSGYTLLKSGKVREKISVSLVRSGLDSGSFGKFSAGEAARVNLATILAMQKLINGNCDTDKGLDLLVLDEILEAVDEEGLASMFSALNNLSLTALVVSHGNIAESYPYTLKIVKENGESRIEI